MTEDDLRQFDKEVLVQFIYADSVFYRQETIAKLQHYQKRLRFNKLMSQSENISEEMRRCDGLKDAKKFIALMKKDEKIHREINKLLGV